MTKIPSRKVLSQITKPLMVIMGGSDEWADRPVKEIILFFKKYNRSINFKSTIIPGAFHSYGGKEREVASKIASWIKNSYT